MTRTALAMLALTGCFFDASTGVQAPTRHGYGNWGIPLSVTIGGDAKTRYGRIGGGGHAHLFVSPNSSEPDSLGWAAGGLQVRNELAVLPLWERMRDSGTRYYDKQIVIVTTLSGGLGGGRAYREDDASRATYIDAYVGAGVSNQRGTKRMRWRAWSAGVAATRIWLGDRDPAWFVGVAATLGLGLEDR